MSLQLIHSCLQTIIFLGTGALLIIISLGTGAFNAQTIILFSIIVRICTWILLILYSQVLQWACPSLARQRRALCFLVGREILVYRQVLISDAVHCNPAYRTGHTEITIIEQPTGVGGVHNLMLPAPRHCVFDRTKQHMSTVRHCKKLTGNPIFMCTEFSVSI